MKKTIFTLLTACWLLSCNKDTTEIEVPPFSVYPNPFVNQMSIHFDTNRFPDSGVTIRLLDDKEKVVISTDWATSIGDLSFSGLGYPKGLYYIEMVIENQKFITAIIKAE